MNSQVGLTLGDLVGVDPLKNSGTPRTSCVCSRSKRNQAAYAGTLCECCRCSGL